jgi:hypothetical protein
MITRKTVSHKIKYLPNFVAKVSSPGDFNSAGSHTSQNFISNDLIVLIHRNAAPVNVIIVLFSVNV